MLFCIQIPHIWVVDSFYCIWKMVFFLHFWLILQDFMNFFHFSIFKKKKLRYIPKISQLILKVSLLDYHLRVVATLRNGGALKKLKMNFLVHLTSKNYFKQLLPWTKNFEIGPRVKEIYPSFLKYLNNFFVMHKNGKK